jgi:DNA-binding NtrC family response regulator
MENKENVLVVGRHSFIMEKVITILRQQGYQAIGASTDEQAIDMISNQELDAVIFGGGVEPESIELIESKALAINEKIKFVRAHPQTILEDLKKVLSEI